MTTFSTPKLLLNTMPLGKAVHLENVFVPFKHAYLKGMTTKPLMVFARVKRKGNPWHSW